VHAQLGERILELVHDGYQLFHAHVAGHRGQLWVECCSGRMCLTGEDGGVQYVRSTTTDSRADSLLFYSDTPAMISHGGDGNGDGGGDDDTRTTHNHVSHRPLDNKRHHWQQQKQNIRTEAIVRTDTDDCACARAHPRLCEFLGVCVCVCVCACACGGKWQRLQSNGPALSDSDE